MQQFDLISSDTGESIALDGGELLYWPNLFDGKPSFKELMDSISWQEETLKIYGVERVVPRLVAWYGDKGAHYRYSGVDHITTPWNQSLLKIKAELEQITGEQFNSCLCNLYRNGQDSMGWHSDNEKELGVNPVIASISYGATRNFHLKHRVKPKLRHKISLTSGSLLIMKGQTQTHWVHQIPKEPKVLESRINLTFRNIINH